MARSYEQRRIDRVARIDALIDFLEGRMKAGMAKKPDRDTAQISALRWALEEIARFDTVEAALHDDALSTPFIKLVAIGVVVNSRHEPSDEDIRRTTQLMREHGWKLSLEP